MKDARRAASTFPKWARVPALLALLLATSLPAVAQHRGARPGSGSGSGSHSRTAVPRQGGGGGTSVPGGGRSNWSHRSGGSGHHSNHGGHFGGHYGHHGHYGRFYPYYPYGSFWSGYFLGYWSSPYPYGYDYGYGYGRRAYGYGAGADMGALDLDVSPGDAEVYLDGHLVGKVDAFDGFPQYLWLDEGTYDVAFYRDGYRTLARQITIYPGLVIDVDDRLERGPSTRPEDLETKTHDRRDSRLRFERERRERLEREGRYRDDDRDRREDDRSESGRWEDRRDDDADEAEEPRAAAQGDQGRLRLDVEPKDASVYLDGRFVGTGEELARLRSGLLVDSGNHRIAVVRPGRRGSERDFDVPSGEEVELEIDLDSAE